ncbi:MAG: ATP-dependent DNA helicase RecG [Acidobacteriaceae bacterium]
MAIQLSTPVKFVRRIGPRIAAGLAQRGIVTVEDLLYHLPFRYEDRLHPKPLSLYHPGEMASLTGEVRGTVLLRTRSGPIFEMTVGITPPAPYHPQHPNSPTRPQDPDPWLKGLVQPPPTQVSLTPGSFPGAPLETVKCMWFHGAYLKDKFRPGQRIALYGKLEASRSGNAPNASGASRFKLIQPTFEILPDPAPPGDPGGEDHEFILLEMGRIVPIYESLGGTTPWGAKLSSRWLRRVMWTIFKDLLETPQTAATAAEALPVAAAPAQASAPTGPPAQPPDTQPPDTLPAALCQRLSLPTRMDALRDLHFPPADTSLVQLMSARTPAHRRLIFEEFFYLELGLELKRRRLRERRGTAFLANDQVRAALKQLLPFKPTAAQKRVLGEIVQDMRSIQPMRRLLQGDVGSGKTIVALQAALVAIENGYQVALMAPTGILATQHFLYARKLLGEKISPRNHRHYRIALLTGSLDDRSKRQTSAAILRGEIDLAIGTHALVQESVDFARLGLVIIDEQHRFGVQQRLQLLRKPRNPSADQPADNLPATIPLPDAASPPAPPLGEPDMLVMTATPIPRTLAMTLYGDLDASVIDQLPPGRTPILTRRVAEDRADQVWTFLRKQVAAGRQAYIVYPIIEGDHEEEPQLDFALESLPEPPQATKTRSTAAPRRSTTPARNPTRAQAFTRLRSAVEMHQELQQGALAGLRLGLLHGRMSADEKEIAMNRFKRGELEVLVATTVIEVGVDVPNATVMVIEHAERFGLAQLHQLRGRVGRGDARSYCILVTGANLTPEADLRLNAMVQTQDGFVLAEQDLAQRGPGEFFGARQAGLPDLRVANLARDRDLLELARQEAARFADHPDPNVPDWEREAVWSRLKNQWQRRYGLLEA